MHNLLWLIVISLEIDCTFQLVKQTYEKEISLQQPKQQLTINSY